MMLPKSEGKDIASKWRKEQKRAISFTLLFASPLRTKTATF